MDKAKKEILRYLGHSRQEVTEDLSALIDECMSLMRSTAKVRHVTRVADIEFSEDGIHVAGTGLVLKGVNIARHLSGCCRTALFAATLGVSADNLIRVQEKTDLTRSLILDACATQLIEESCDKVEAQIREEASATGLSATRRFSPGYGDFPLDIQPELVAVLGAEKAIGLTCTENLILLPRKSVTAVIGLGGKSGDTASGCASCPMHGKCGYERDENCNECP